MGGKHNMRVGSRVLDKHINILKKANKKKKETNLVIIYSPTIASAFSQRPLAQPLKGVPPSNNTACD